MKTLHRRFCRITASATVAVALAGCSLFAPKSETVTVNSIPQGADVWVGGKCFRTPCAVELPCGENASLSIRKEGYHPYNKRLFVTLGSCGMMDVIGGCICLVPFIGLASNNGSHTFEEHAVVAVLVEKEP
ncbi:MAG: PEGA domain-containing protein [Victivallaceae bacterium]|nr:PEGA domain-containing protein [Victivallaceae bacterium]